jgi:hypothetical protein
VLGDESFLPFAQRKKRENPIQHIPQRRRLFDSLRSWYIHVRERSSLAGPTSTMKILSPSQPLFGGDPFAIYSFSLYIRSVGSLIASSLASPSQFVYYHLHRSPLCWLRSIHERAQQQKREYTQQHSATIEPAEPMLLMCVCIIDTYCRSYSQLCILYARHISSVISEQLIEPFCHISISAASLW